MIDYAILCQAIEDWKTGRPATAVPAAAARPQPPARPATPAAAAEAEPEEVVEYSGFYEAGEPAPEQADSTVIYQLPDYENVDVNEEDQ
jgi:hypothetical protein